MGKDSKIASYSFAVLIMAAATIAIINFMASVSNQNRQGVRATAPSSAPVKASLPLPPIEDGLALVLLVDNSGSMEESVRDGAGESSKIAIAKRVAKGIVQQVAEFAAKNPALKVKFGLYGFSDDSTTTYISLREGIAIKEAEKAIGWMGAAGGTPIGTALRHAQSDTAATRLSRRHIIVVTDGENTVGPAPETVLPELNGKSEEETASIYFVAFDVSASRFKPVSDLGVMVAEARSGDTLKQALDMILTEKVFAEMPLPVGTK
jgi:hypothetical protein